MNSNPPDPKAFGLTLEQNVSLADYTTFQLGGSAQHFVRVRDEHCLVQGLRWAAAAKLPAAILAGGSNLVVSDKGFPGLVLRMETHGVELDEASADRHMVVAQAGECWDDLVALSVEKGLSGLECLSGIPGSVGATPIQNVGAYGQAVSDTLQSVRLLDRASLEVETWPAEACAFAYRSSHFKQVPDRYVILSAAFALPRRAPAVPRAGEIQAALPVGPTTAAGVREAVLTVRRRKSMVLDPADENRRSAGSFFVNPILAQRDAAALLELLVAQGLAGSVEDVPHYPSGPDHTKFAAAWLIERAGFAKGSRRGPAGQSSKHALALVHHGGGTTQELLDYARSIRNAVQQRFGVQLQHEPTLWGEVL